MNNYVRVEVTIEYPVEEEDYDFKSVTNTIYNFMDESGGLLQKLSMYKASRFEDSKDGEK